MNHGNWSCLLFDTGQGKQSEGWLDKTADQEFAFDIHYATSLKEATDRIATGEVVALMVFADHFDAKIEELFRVFQTNVGALAEFVSICCDDPDPGFLTSIYEFGVEQFFGTDRWVNELQNLGQLVGEKLGNKETAEYRTYHLTRSIRAADQEAIKNAQAAIEDMVEYDFRAAYAQGKAFEAVGDFAGAVQAFRDAQGMNKMFRPSSSRLGETLIVTGQVDEAIKIFDQMEKANPSCSERKAHLASAYVEKGDIERATYYADEAERLNPENSTTLEARAQILISQGKIGEAFKLMDKMSDVGPFFAAKLNDMGIKLSKAGKGKSAIALYNKAHKIVRPDLRYKISLNASLACRRFRDYKKALQFIERAQEEFGMPMAKLDKIRKTVLAEIKAIAAGKKPAA